MDRLTVDLRPRHRSHSSAGEMTSIHAASTAEDQVNPGTRRRVLKNGCKESVSSRASSTAVARLFSTSYSLSLLFGKLTNTSGRQSRSQGSRGVWPP